jgi:hypothetical protein
VSVGHAVDASATAFGVVHSVFDHAVNLMICGDMWTLLAKTRADLPFGIRVTLTKFDTLSLRRGDRVTVRSGFVGIGPRLVVDCRVTPRWMPVNETMTAPGMERRLAAVAAAAHGRSWHDSAQMAHAVRSAVSDGKRLDDVLARVVGRGPGATPSGDDVLVGVLAVLTCSRSGAAGDSAAKALGRSLMPLLPRTTDVSGQLLRQAVNGLFCRDLHELVSGLLGAPSPRQLGDKVRRVIEIGATSGADMCEGLLAFAPFYFVTDNQRG